VSAADLPEVGEIVTVRTRLHSGEPARVTEVQQSNRGFAKWWVRLEEVDGSLYGAQGWYATHEFDRLGKEDAEDLAAKMAEVGI
jgi:hypothetical protein